MTIRIWYRYENRRAEIVDRVETEKQAQFLTRQYALSFGTLPGQPRHGKDKVWYGRRDAEPVNNMC